MKPFNLEEAKAGKPVCTLDGRNVRILCFDRICEEFPIIGLIEDNDGVETCVSYTNEGRYSTYTTNSLDLMMKSTKREGWIVLVPYNSRLENSDTIIPDKMNSANIYVSKEAAMKHNKNRGIPVKIEWED